MDKLAIEINGAELLVSDQKSVIVSEPGIAIVDGSEIIVGSAAWNQARLQPAKSRSGFWSGLALEGGSAHTNAELAFEHLKHVWLKAGKSNASAVLVVPDRYNADQLGLVLGIAQECGIRVDAMINAAIAASEVRYSGAKLFFVDASLRSLSVTRLDAGSAAAVDTCETSPTHGLAELYDETVRAIARVFVLETRFDPLHRAETEQALYNGLPRWLEDLNRTGAVTAEIPYEGDVLAVELNLERVRSASLRLAREIVRLIGELRAPGEPAVVQLNASLAKLPGLCAELGRIEGLDLEPLETGFPARSALSRIDQGAAAGEEVRLLKRLPYVSEKSTGSSKSAAAARPGPVRQSRPTHVVLNGIGYRLDRGPVQVVSSANSQELNGSRVISIGTDPAGGRVTHCVLSFADDALSVERSGASTLLINGTPVRQRQQLAAGDVIRVNDEAQAELHIVELEE